VYECRPHVVIITLGNKLYKISEIASPTAISLVNANQCNKFITKTKKFFFPNDPPSGKEEDCGHDLQIGPLFTKTTDG
jgi:hypothetical protein